MSLTLKNKNVEIHVDEPFEKYTSARFDWTGKITDLLYLNTPLTTFESLNNVNRESFGRGLYNEFGIETALGFNETKKGDWFHKIGVGLLRKEDAEYAFGKDYEIKPAEFNIISDSNHINFTCSAAKVNGYSYSLKKRFVLNENGFAIHYLLENTGDKPIVTDEYCHNFLAIDNDWMNANYRLKFSFRLKPELFEESVNREQKVEIGENEISFNGTPKDPFFFSHLSGRKSVRAAWELVNTQRQIGIRETGSFETDKINLWGWKHVVSPELFYKITLKPGQKTEWSRTYDLFKF